MKLGVRSRRSARASMAASGLVLLAGPSSLTAAPPLTWERLHVGGGDLQDVVEFGGTLVAVGPSGVLTRVADGPWLAQQLDAKGVFVGGPYAVPVAWSAAAHVASQFVILGTDTRPDDPWGVLEGQFASSPDGLSWTLQKAFDAGTSGTAWMNLVPFPGGLAAVGGVQHAQDSYALASHTANGIDWTRADLPGEWPLESPPLYQAIYAAGALYAVGGSSYLSGSADVLVSTNGVDWAHALSRSPGAPLASIAAGAGWLVAAGQFSTIERSRDGLQWTSGSCETASPFPSDARQIVYANGRFLVVGTRLGPTADQTLFLSGDGGAAWSATDLPRNLAVRDLAGVAGRFVCAGPAGALLTSVNGVDWETAATGVTNDLNAVRVTGDRCYVVGDNAVILRSNPLPIWLEIASVSPLELRVNGPAGRDGQLQATPSLLPADWQTVATFTLDSDPWTWRDESSPSPQRYYRAVAQE